MRAQMALVSAAAQGDSYEQTERSDDGSFLKCVDARKCHNDMKQLLLYETILSHNNNKKV